MTLFQTWFIDSSLLLLALAPKTRKALAGLAACLPTHRDKVGDIGHTSIGVGQPCPRNRKAASPGIERGLQEPECHTPVHEQLQAVGGEAVLIEKHVIMGRARGALDAGVGVQKEIALTRVAKIINIFNSLITVCFFL